jgi:UPF0271 protein
VPSERPIRQRVDLNVDLGELPGEPVELYRIATTVNVACGGHAGDVASMTHAVTHAIEAGARIAAHPSYVDREGFGRRRGFSSHDAVRRDVELQCAELARIAEEHGGRVVAVKPHGALYHDVATDPRLAAMVVEAAHEALGPDISIVGPPHGALVEAAAFDRLVYVREGFADRRYDAVGGLVPRGEPGAVLDDPAACAAQAVALAQRGEIETLCVHGDNPNALAVARAVRAALEETDWLFLPA